jgi:hypothetical protein
LARTVPGIDIPRTPPPLFCSDAENLNAIGRQPVDTSTHTAASPGLGDIDRAVHR